MTMARANERRSGEATVGLAFLPKKLPRVLTQKMLELASAAGLRLLPLDPHQSLEAQAPAGRAVTMTTTTTTSATTTGAATTTMPATERCFITQPFDLILHKLHTDPVWEAHLADYTARHPGVRVLDSLSAVRATDDRAAMLAAIPPSGLRLRLSLHAAPAASAATAPVHTASAATPQLVGPEPQQQRPQQQQSQNLSSSAAAAAVGYGSCGGSSVEGSGDGGGGGGGGDADGAAVAAAWGSGMELEVEVRAPVQAVVGSREKVRALAAMAAAAGGEGVRPVGLRPPLILKTQRADAAGGGSHGLAVALTWDELADRAEDMQRAAAAAATPAASAAAGASGNVGRGQVDGEESSWVPLVVQQYVPHTENLYKVYVLGDHVQAGRRASLTLSQLTTLQQAHAERSAGQRQQQQQESAAAPAAAAMTSVSGAAAMTAPPCPLLLQHISAQPQPQPQSGDGPTVPPPPPAAAAAPSAAAAAGGPGRAAPGAGAAAALDDRVLGAVARELSLRMGLTMFNFDVVVAVPNPDPDLGPLTVPEVAGGSASGGSAAVAAAPSARRAGAATGAGRDPLLLYVVDVNYFPGYDKMTGWEPHLVAHLRAAADGTMMMR